MHIVCICKKKNNDALESLPRDAATFISIKCGSEDRVQEAAARRTSARRLSTAGQRRSHIKPCASLGGGTGSGHIIGTFTS